LALLAAADSEAAVVGGSKLNDERSAVVESTAFKP
jgi:hypothetical protein